jgi:RNA polymerase sigma factor (sigma-70 family)
MTGLTPLSGYLRRLAGTALGADEVLLNRFAHDRDEDAFAALVARHGPMVLGVCRRLLADPRDVEDAFQATFLVLARRAGSLRRPTQLAAWLYGVARRNALNRRRTRVRRQERQAHFAGLSDPHPDPLEEVSARELLAILDEEVQRLPEVYRLPVVLCCLESRSQEEAAALLGWTPGSVKGRLERGRERLQARLERRGLSLSACLLPAALGSTPVSAALASATARAAVMLRTGATVRLPVVLLLLGAALAAGAAVLVRPAAPPGQPAAGGKSSGAAGPKRTDLHGDPLPPGAIARLGSLRLRTTDGITAIAYSPDGRLLATACRDRLIHIWDTATGKRVRTQEWRRRGPVTSLLFEADGKTVTASQTFIARSLDGKVTAVAADHRGVSVRQTGTGRELCRLDWHANRVAVLALSADGKRIACCEKRGPVSLGDARPGGKRIVLKSRRDNQYWRSLAFSPDGKWLIGAGYHHERAGKDAANSVGTVHCWDAATGKLVREDLANEKAPAGVAVAFSPDGKLLATASSNRSVRLWDAGSFKLVRELRTFEGMYDWNCCLAFTPDGKTLAASSDRNTVDFWDVPTGTPRLRYDGHGAGVSAIAFSQAGRVLVSLGGDGTVRVWNPRTARQLRVLHGQAPSLESLALSPDGRVIAAGGWGGVVHLWDTARGRLLRTLCRKPDRSRAATCLAFSPDGKLLAAGERIYSLRARGADNEVSLWEVASGKLLRELKGHQQDRIEFAGLRGLRFSPDGRTLVSAGSDQTVIRWEVGTGKALSRFTINPVGLLGKVAFSADAATLACYSLIGEKVHFWDVPTGRATRSLEGVPGGDFSLAYSPDGRFFATSSWGAARGRKPYARAVRVWEVASGREVLAFNPEGPVESVAFSHDGKVLATGQSNTTCLLWDLLPPPTVRRTLTELWTDLAAEDAARAHTAVSALVGRPDEAIALLERRLRPVAPVDAKHLARLIADLGSDDFFTRQKASDALQKLGDRPRGALENALAGKPELEVRRRLETLLARLRRHTLSPEALREQRAVLVLEWVGSPGARRILKSLAAGVAGARLTREATAALRRLAHP